MLTPEQEQAIAFGDGYLHLIACAGSGKTETITRRVARLVADGVPPGSIVAFTFTNRAAGEMAARVRDHLSASETGEDEFAGLYVGTIHSYCHQRLAQAVPRYLAFDLLDNDDLRPLFCRRHFGEVGLAGLGALCRRSMRYGRTRDPSPYEIIHDFCRNADLVRDERIDPGEQSEEPFRGCYLAYLDLLGRHHYLDFAGMIACYLEALEGDAALLARERERVRHLVVDEYQDVNRLQEALIRLMAGERGNLCVVGDDDQCIYQWRGSNYENIISFRTRYPDVTTIRIEENFRSTPGIIGAAAEVIGRNADRLPKAMRPWSGGLGRTEEGDLAACFFAREADELGAVIQQIRLLDGVPYTDTRGTRSRPRLRRHGDPDAVRAGSRAAPPGRPGPGRDRLRRQRRPALREARGHGGHGGVRLPRRLSVPAKEQRPAAERRPRRPSPPRRELRRPAVGRHGPRRVPVRDGGAREGDRPRHGARAAAPLSPGRAGDRAARAPLPEGVDDNLGKLSQLVTAFEHVYPRITREQLLFFLDYVEDHAMSQAGEGGADERLARDALTVSTLHGAKGLQFPVVFMPRLNAGEFPVDWRSGTRWLVPDPLFDRARYDGGVEDERRVFYVGLTRSEKYLYLSGHYRGDGVPDPGERSVFFDEFSRTDDVAGRFPLRPTARDDGPADADPLSGRRWRRAGPARYYAGCPFGNRVRFVYGFDPVPKEDIGIGRAVHNVLAAVHQRALDGDLDPAEVPGLVDETRSCASRHLR